MFIPMNLQIFAESVETPEVAEPVSEETAEVVDTQVEGAEVQEPAEPVIDENAIYAAARRASDKQMNELNKRISDRFGKLTNPETGKPIQSVYDYLDALEAQERVQARQQMQERGVDPEILSRLIANDPTIRKAQKVLEENTMREGERELNEQIKKLSEIDPSIKSFDDLPKMENFKTFDALVRNNGLNFVDAYRLANFEKLSQKDAAATKQAAINAAKGKSHMVPTAGLTVNDGLEEIPVADLAKWKAFFPEASAKELKEKYNRAKRR